MSISLDKKIDTRSKVNKDGKLDHNSLSLSKKSALRAKFADEAHFCFGKAMVLRHGRKKGTRLLPFENILKREAMSETHPELVYEET